MVGHRCNKKVHKKGHKRAGYVEMKDLSVVW